MERQNQNDAVLSARVPDRLKQLVEEYISRDCHLNESDFLRDAVREKIKRDAPDLYRKLFQEKPVIEGF